MDPDLDVLHGPHPIQDIGTVSVPKELMRAVGLEPRDKVHWALSREIPGALLLVPSRQVSRSMDKMLRLLGDSGR